MPWQEVSVVDQRLEFVRLAESGLVSFAELCRRFGVKRDTGYKWLERYRREGVDGLADRSRRPHRSPGRTLGACGEAGVSRERGSSGVGRTKDPWFSVASGPCWGAGCVDDHSDTAPPWPHIRSRGAGSCLSAFRGRRPEPALADGFQRLVWACRRRPGSPVRTPGGLSSFLCEVVVHVVGSRRPGKVMANALSACFHPWVPVPSSPPLLFPMLRIAK